MSCFNLLSYVLHIFFLMLTNGLLKIFTHAETSGPTRELAMLASGSLHWIKCKWWSQTITVISGTTLWGEVCASSMGKK